LTLTETLGPAYQQIIDLFKSGDFEGAVSLAITTATAALKIGLIQMKQGVHESSIVVREVWAQLWSSFANGPTEAIAEIKDLIQELTDWTNRLLGRDVPNRISNLEKFREQIRNEEDARQAGYEQERQAYEQQVNAIRLELQAEVDKSKDRAKQAREEQKKIQLPPRSGEISPPGAMMASQLQSGLVGAQQQQAYFVDAVSRRTQEGQRAIYESLNQQAAQDQTTEAVKSLEGTLEDEFERTRREQRQSAVVIRGSRK
jgi:hypothetical protein